MARNNEQKIIFLIVALGLIAGGTLLFKNAVTKTSNNSELTIINDSTVVDGE